MPGASFFPAHHDLSRFAQAKVERDQHLRHGAGEMRKNGRKCIDRFSGPLRHLFVVAKYVTAAKYLALRRNSQPVRRRHYRLSFGERRFGLFRWC